MVCKDICKHVCAFQLCFLLSKGLSFVICKIVIMLPDIQLTSYWVKLSNFCKAPCLELSKIIQIPTALIVIIITGVIINVSSGDKWTWQICTNSPIVIVCVYVCTYTHTSDHNSLPTSKVKAFYFILWQALKKPFICMYVFIFFFIFYLEFLFIFYFLFIYLFIICSGFCDTLKWNSHGFTCVPHPDPPSHLPLHPLPLGFPSAPGPSTCLMHPTWAGDLFHPR